MSTQATAPDKFTEFVLEHENDDTARLLLSKGRWKDVDIDLAVNTILSRRKLRDKVPAWYSHAGLVYPAKLSAEQCSSQDTAGYKAGLALRLHRGQAENCSHLHRTAPEANAIDVPEDETRHIPEPDLHIADLTGGLGVDSWAFSKVAGKVFYNEMDPALAHAAQHNFLTLGASGISVHNSTLSPGSTAELLEDFRPGIIFLDPARRADDGKKVFMIEDCRPDVLGLKDELLDISKYLMVKLSPMADISMVTEKLGRQCRELHVVASGGECKELLAVLDRDFGGECRIVVCSDADRADRGIFSFTRTEERSASASFISGKDEAAGHAFLFEPGKALMKSGAFNLISSRFGIKKISRSTHLYLFSEETLAATLKDYGKVFRILEVLPMNGRGIRLAGEKYPEAEVSARNIRMSSDLLRKKLGTRPGDRYHIFGAEYLFVTSKMKFL